MVTGHRRWDIISQYPVPLIALAPYSNVGLLQTKHE